MILNIILFCLVLIGIRLFHLAVIQYDEKFEESKKPQRKTVIEPATRATIRDRFNSPLAINQVTYRVGVLYQPIRQVKQVEWRTDDAGKRVKVYRRKEYIKELSQMLGKELSLDPGRIEDLIYSKAALYFSIPYLLKEDLSEKSYYRLKMREKDFPGLFVERLSKRHYPKARVAGDIIGYMGAISREEYETNIHKMKALSNFILDWENGEDPPLPEGFSTPYEVRGKLKELEELAYTSQDFVGKTGIEGLFEKELRGHRGKRSFYSDSRGNFLKELPGAREPVPGKRVLLSLSSELQEYAEQLLAINETVRVAKSQGHGRSVKNKKQPWIKGGAIVAIEPNSGEVLALATYPRFDPSDFVLSKDEFEAKEKASRINRWFENEAHIRDLWNQKRPLVRERFQEKAGGFIEEERWITFDNYLDFILPKDHPILTWFKEKGTVKEAVTLLTLAKDLERSGKPLREWIKETRFDESESPLFKRLDFLKTPYTKLLLIDLCQVAVDEERFDDELLDAMGQMKVSEFKDSSSAFYQVEEGVKQMTKELFHDLVFIRWRELYEKDFLKEKREIEKLNKSYQKPYLDYLDEKERELFGIFWDKVRLDLVLSLVSKEKVGANIKLFTPYFQELQEELVRGAHSGIEWKEAFQSLFETMKDIPLHKRKSFLAAFRSYDNLTRPLKGKYPKLVRGKKEAVEKDLAKAFYPSYGYGYARSHAYRQASTQGSIFKLVTAYEALNQVNHDALEKGRGLINKNPIDVTDQIFKNGNHVFVGYTASHKPIPQLYKGGRIPRSHNYNLGKMDLLRAIETSSNLYFCLLASDVIKKPSDLIEAAKLFGFGEKTGIELPGELKGKLPDDLEKNPTGLFAFSIGQHTLVVTPLQTAMFLTTLAERGELLKPQIVKVVAATTKDGGEDFLQSPEESFGLSAIGLDFQLFEDQNVTQKKAVLMEKGKEIKRKVPLPKELRDFLLEGMHKVVLKTQSESLGTLSRLYRDYPEAISDYVDLKHQLIGKTSTSESLERIDLDEEEGTNLYTHVWFGGIAFKDDVHTGFKRPELVVVVYLRFGFYGKEAAPIAAQIVNKWRLIKQERGIE